MISNSPPRLACGPQGHDPAGAPWNRIPIIGRRQRSAGGGGLRHAGAGESEAILLLVARVVPVLSEPGPWRALFRADPVLRSQGLGDRAAADRETIFATLPVMAALFLPVVLGLHDLYRWSRRGSRARCAASLEGAIPQRAVLPDPGGALLRNLVRHRHPLLPRLARSGRDRGSRRVGPPAPPRRARHHRPRADPDVRVDRLDHVAHAALVSTMFGVYFFAGSFVGFIALLSVVDVAMRRPGCSTRSSAPSTCTISESFLFAFTAFWAYIASPSSSS